MPTAYTTNVRGIALRRPPILRMSCSSWQPWITDPAERNSSALKNAWAIRWNIAAATPPVPSASIMNPSCETVE